MTVGGGGHIKNFATQHAIEIKEFTKVLFEPLLDETRQIRINQQTVIYNQHVQQHQDDGKTLDEAIELANEVEWNAITFFVIDTGIMVTAI